MDTTFYVYKKGDTYLKIEKNLSGKGSMFKPVFVKDINKASYWKEQRDAKSWTPEKQFPGIKLVPCGLCERPIKKQLKKSDITKVLKLHDKVSGGMGSSVADQKRIAKQLKLKPTVVSNIIQIHEDNKYTRDSKLILSKLTKK